MHRLRNFSDGHSEDVPEGGLMGGEPSVLSYLSEDDEPNGAVTPASLTASLFMDEDKLSCLITAISMSLRPLKSVDLCILAALFESEVSELFVDKPWMSHDYGLLMKGESTGHTRARIESIALYTGAVSLIVNAAREDGDGSLIDKAVGGENCILQMSSPDLDRAHLRYQRYILTALVVLIVVTIFTA